MKTYITSETAIIQTNDRSWSWEEISAKVEGVIGQYEIRKEHPCFADGNHNCPQGTYFVLIRIPKELVMSK